MKKFLQLIKWFLNLIAKEIIEFHTQKGKLSITLNTKKLMNEFVIA